MSDYIAVITQAGINAAISAQSNGMTINLGHISVGTSGYTPNRNQTRLQTQVDRVPVTGSEKVGNDQWRVVGTFERGNYAAREVGIHMDDDAQTLFAVFSHPTDAIFYKTQNASVFQPFTLALTAVPFDAITITPSTDLSIFYGHEFMQTTIAQTQLAASMINTMYRQIQFSEKINQLEAHNANA